MKLMKRGILTLFLFSLLFISSCGVCTKEGKVCEDGTVVGREGPDCEFAECPDLVELQEEVEPEFCVGEGESIAITHPDYAEDCCEGLVQISNKDPDFSGAGICTGNCGDGICNEDSESSYNCEIDCELEPTEYNLDLTMKDLPEGYQEIEEYLPKYGEVFGVHFFASNKVSDAKLIYAMNIMAEYLDNDKDGSPDNPLVVDRMVSDKVGMMMFEDEDEDEDSELWESDLEIIGLDNLQGLYEDETNPSGSRFDASLEEILHLITQRGYAEVYPEIFGEFSGSTVANLMDEARGGHFEEGTNWDEDSGEGDSAVPNSYPSESWYHYDDETCDYACMITEYVYWSLTSILGAQENRCSDIDHEWELCTKEKVQEKDSGIYNLLTDPQYKFATIIPDGSY